METGGTTSLTDCDTFRLDISSNVQKGGALVLLITHHEIKGMVGETEYWAEAHIYDTVTHEVSKPMTWVEIKAAYSRVSGKDNRVALWHIMNQCLSPKAKEQIYNDITADAISRVI